VSLLRELLQQQARAACLRRLYASSVGHTAANDVALVAIVLTSSFVMYV
jgi:hypothetical protein